MFLLWSWGSIVTFWFNRKSKMATMDSDWLRHLQLLLKIILHGLSLKLPQLLLSSFNIHLSYFISCQNDVISSGRKDDFCFQVATIVPTKKSRLGKLWGHIHQRPEKIATSADIYQLSDTGPIGPLVQLFFKNVRISVCWLQHILYSFLCPNICLLPLWVRLPVGPTTCGKGVFLAVGPYWLTRCQYNVTEWHAVLILQHCVAVN